MTIQRIIELLEIEHECMLRGAHNDCERDCANCELVQDDGDLHEMYLDVIALLKEQDNCENCAIAIEDRQPVVRCKDCKNWIAGYITDQDEFIPSKCGKYQQMVGHSSDDFCSLAERQ